MFTNWIKKIKLLIPTILITIFSVYIIGNFINSNEVYAEESTEYIEFSRDNYKSDHYYYKISSAESFAEFYLQYRGKYGSSLGKFDKCTISIEVDFDFDEEVVIHTSTSSSTSRTTLNNCFSGYYYYSNENFYGIIKGNDHSISNMKLSCSSYNGFISILGSSSVTYASVDGLYFYNCKISACTYASNNVDMGIVVGRCYGSVTNCNVYNSTVICESNSGGITGLCYNLIYNCNVYNTNIYATKAAGGITGNGTDLVGNSKIINCGVYDSKVLNMTDEQYVECNLEYKVNGSYVSCTSGLDYINNYIDTIYGSAISTISRGGIVGYYESKTEVINCVFTSTGEASQAVIQGADYGQRLDSPTYIPNNIYAIGGFGCANNYFFGTITYEHVLGINMSIDYVSRYNYNTPTYGKNYFNTASNINSDLDMVDTNNAAIFVSNPSTAASYMNSYNNKSLGYLLSKVSVVTKNNYEYLSLAKVALNTTFTFNSISDEDFAKFANLDYYAFYSDSNYELTALDSKIDLVTTFDNEIKTITMSCDYFSDYKYFWYCAGFDGDKPIYVVADSFFDEDKTFYGDYVLYSVMGAAVYNENKTISAEATISNLDFAYYPEGANVPITVEASYGYATSSYSISNIDVKSYKDINTISTITYYGLNTDVDISKLDFELYNAIYKLYYFDMAYGSYYDYDMLYENSNGIDTKKALTYVEYAYGEQITTLINRSDYTDSIYTLDGLEFTNWDKVEDAINSDEGLYMPDSDGYIFAAGTIECQIQMRIGVRNAEYIDEEDNIRHEDMWLGNHIFISSSKDVLDTNVEGVAISHMYQASDFSEYDSVYNGYAYTSSTFEGLMVTINFRSNSEFYLFIEYPTGTYYFDIFNYYNQVYHSNVTTMAELYNHFNSIIMPDGAYLNNLFLEFYTVELKTPEDSEYTDNYITDNVGYYLDSLNFTQVSNIINIYPKEPGYKVEVLDTNFYYANNKISFMFDYDLMESYKLVITVGAILEHYSIYYFVNDNLWLTDNGSDGLGYVVGDEISYIDDIPYKDGCIFSGWSEIPSTMPAQSIYIYGYLQEQYSNQILFIPERGRAFNDTELFLSTYSSGNYDEIDKVYVANYYKTPTDTYSYTLDFTYLGDKYLWIYDYTIGEYKCLDNYKINGTNNTTIELYSISATYNNEYLTVENLGIHIKSTSSYSNEVCIKITPIIGYRAVSKSALYEINENNIYVEVFHTTVIGSEVIFNYDIPLAHEIIEYKLSYMIGSARVLTEEYTYNQEVNMNLDILEGTEFKTWDTIITSMPAEDIIVHAVKNVSYVIMQSPIISKLHEKQKLEDATITGGILYVDGNQVEGYFYFNNPNTIVYKSDSFNTRFDITFVCTSHPYVSYTFDTEIEVCNPMYSGILDPLIIISRRSTTIEFVINEKYEYSYDNVTYYKGSHVRMAALKPDTDYSIYYRYAEDLNYCPSLPVLRIIHTMSKDEELYIDTCVAALDFVDSAERELDNKASEERLIVIKYEYSLPYENRVRTGSEAKTYYDYFTEVFNLTIAIENNRLSKRSLIVAKVNAMDNYSEEKTNEIYELAFDNNTDITSLRSYAAYVCGAMDTGDLLISDFIIDAGYDPNLIEDLTSMSLVNKASLDTTVTYVGNKVDEIFGYDYNDYEVINLDEFKNDFVGETLVLQSNIISQVHSHDSVRVTATVSKKIETLEAKTYMDYKFDRAEYDKAFLEAAEVAIVCHIQGIVLTNLDTKYNEKNEALVRKDDKQRLLAIYEELKDHYEDYDAFYADYTKIVSENSDISYDEVLEVFNNKLDKEVILPVSKNLTENEIILLVFFGLAMVTGVTILIAIRRINRKRGEAHE